jgi:hypothetical protein
MWENTLFSSDRYVTYRSSNFGPATLGQSASERTLNSKKNAVISLGTQLYQVWSNYIKYDQI